MTDRAGFQPGRDNSWQAYIQEPPIPKRVRRVRPIKWDLKHDRRQMDAALMEYKYRGGRRLFTPHEDRLILTTRPLKSLCTLLDRSPDSIWSRHTLLKKMGYSAIPVQDPSPQPIETWKPEDFASCEKNGE